ncbi:MAG: PAS domain S-box protein [Bacteroidales bacterium]|nr:PAS domain S-box protein [Bacteroidales bacterium]MCF8402971.1 PAS domain S-box protein [Bacteroidales bacterium]
MKSLSNISLKGGLNAIITLIVLLGTLSFSIYYVIDENLENKQKLKFLEKESRAAQEKALIMQVDQVINYINYKRSQELPVHDSVLQKEILKYLESIRFEPGGYIFINSYNGKALVFDGKIVEEEMYINDLTEPDGKRLFDLELDAAYNPMGGFMEYMFKPLGFTGEPQPKLSYMRGYDDWQWIIGAGFYVVDLRKENEQIKSEYRAGLRRELFFTLLAIGLLILVLHILGRWYINRVQNELSKFHDFFKQDPEHTTPIDESSFMFSDLRMLAMDANFMVESKKEIEKKLIVSERNYKALVNQAADAIIKGDLDGLITDVNDASTTLTGYKRSELLEMNIRQLFSDKQLIEKPLRVDVLLKGQSIIIERKIKTKTGTYISVEMNTRKMTENYFISIIRDLTERNKAQKELDQYRTKLEDLVAERTKELEEKNKELVRFNDLFIGREFRIKELRDKVKVLEKQIKT